MKLSRTAFSAFLSLLLVFSMLLPTVHAADIDSADATLQQLSLDSQDDVTNEGQDSEATTEDESEKTIPVSVRIEGYDKTIVPLTEFEIAPYDIGHALGRNSKGNEPPLALHAIVKALELQGHNVSNRKKFDFGGGNFISNIDGLKMNSVNPGLDGWMYYVNNEFTYYGVGQHELQPNDEITMFFTTNYGSVKYSWFNQSHLTTHANEEVALELKTVDGTISDATILVNDQPFEVDGKVIRTDEQGVAKLQFTEPGEYHVSAKRMDGEFSNITRPYSKIVVEEKEEVTPEPEPEPEPGKPEEPEQPDPEPAYTVDSIINKLLTFYDDGRLDKKLFPWGVPGLTWTEVVALQATNYLASSNHSLPDWIDQDPGLDENTSDTEHIRYIFALLASGKDPAKAWETERNLYAELAAQQETDGFIGGVNKHVWAMLALDTGEKLGQDVGSWNAKNKQRALDYLLEQQLSDGGFAFSGETADPDMSGMALLALANYKNDSAVENAIQRVKNVLREKQLATAGWGSFGTENSNSIATVISGLVAIGENPLSDSWKKGDVTPLDALQSFQLANGSFTYTLGQYAGTNIKATEQSLIALHEIKTGKSVWAQLAVPSEQPEVPVEPEPETPTEPKPETPTEPSQPTEPEEPNTPTDPVVPVEGKVTLSVEKRTMGQGDVIPAVQVSLQNGDTAYTVLRRIAGEKGIDVIATGAGPDVYVKTIAGLSEFDGGQKSGWMYSVNGDFPQFSAGIYTLQDGDVLRWQYTRNLGEDLGQVWDPEDKEEDVKPGDKEDPDKKPEENGKLPEDIDKTPEVTPDTTEQLEATLENVQQKLLRDGVQTEWQSIGLFRSGTQVPEDYKKIFEQNVQEQIISKVGTGRAKITDIERLILAAGAIGVDPTDVDGKGLNLVAKIYDSEKRPTGEDSLTFQGNNGIIFALIALDSNNYEVPKDAKWNREKLVAELLSNQKVDGSWSLETTTSGTTSVDITAMALAALAPYKEHADVKNAINNTVAFLSKAQGPEGGYHESFAGGVSSEATAQVIIGLTANGFNPRSDAFTKNNKNLLDHLLSFKASDGGFKHLVTEQQSNGMATEQALLALVAYDLLVKGKGSIYDFTDVAIKPVPKPEPTPDQVFTDLTTHWAADYIQQAVKNGIVTGYKDGTFRPNQSLTRAQAVSILVRSLDLKTDKKDPFTDTVNYADETRAEMAAAYHHGLVKGKDGKFMPAAKVTRAQIALMFYRAYEIQNGTKYNGETKTQFPDIKKYDAEAQKAIGMLYNLEMASGENGMYMPGNSTTRAHATKMIIEFSEVK
ncbi:DUF4430 domain-containing protein [Sporosarcina sp. P21c]|uniref:DUF4430 domain-containing protein n=1 Tax=Sporosarcina sp. P21c TaxID=2048255 RepID=UPI0026F4153E|nr:DUF4430 domain-containing protein [Sporosarcina sp. P21c]